MNRRIDHPALLLALEQLKGIPFPGHPDDPDLAEWVLELTELDGHFVGLAVSALASSRSGLTDSTEVARHEALLAELGAVGDDKAIYDRCRQYVSQLRWIEELLSGREG